MIQMSDEQFERLIAKALDELQSRIVDHMKNVAIVWADEPTLEQRRQLMLHHNQSLFGLYEGIPLTKRVGYNMVLPDKITIFKNPILNFARDDQTAIEQIKQTIWHEIAHHYGLNHADIDKLA